MITPHSPMKRFAGVMLGAVLSILLAGCGGGGDDAGYTGGPPPPPPPLESPDKVAALLPSGVTLDSPIAPNEFIGPGFKTVGEALASLHTQVRGKQLVDGGLGQTIHIQKGGEKTAKKARAGGITIVVAE